MWLGITSKGDAIPHLKPSDLRVLAGAGGPAVHTRKSGNLPELARGNPAAVNTPNQGDLIAANSGRKPALPPMVGKWMAQI